MLTFAHSGLGSIAACARHALPMMEKDISADVAHHDRDDREHLNNAMRSGHGPADRPLDPWGSPHGQLADVSMTDPLKTRGEAHGLAQAEQQRDTPLVTRRTEMNELLLAYRALIEQVRLVSRDGRRLIRRLIAVCATSTRSSRVQMTSSPAPLASVPLVVLRSTTEREQIELNDVVQSLSAEGYQVARRGPQWVVYTKIADRRKSGIGQSPHDCGTTAARSERVRSGSLRQRRSDDTPTEGRLPVSERPSQVPVHG